MFRLVIATSISALLMFSLAGLYPGVLARSFIAEHVEAGLLRTPPNLAVVFLGYIFLAGIMSALYRRLGPFSSTRIWSGLKFGLVVAVLWVMPYSIVLFGVYRFPYAALPLDFAWALIEQGVGGVVIALVYGWRRGNA